MRSEGVTCRLAVTEPVVHSTTDVEKVSCHICLDAVVEDVNDREEGDVDEDVNDHEDDEEWDDI
jgi:hypothetical protein